MVSRWILWLGQDYDITHDQPALQVIQANRQTDKTQITIPKIIRLYKNTLNPLKYGHDTRIHAYQSSAILILWTAKRVHRG